MDIMDPKVLDYFVCPNCRGSLRLSSSAETIRQNGNIQEGRLECVGCPSTFLIVHSIPRFVSSESYATSFGFQWKQFPTLQVDKVMQNELSRERFYATTNWPSRLDGQRVLETGCGAGRFTQIALETGAEVFSFDLSSAVEACRQNNDGAPNLHIFQSSIYQIPLRRGTVDKIFCMGVLQHCPEVRKAFLSMVPYLREGGEIVIDVYSRNRFWPPLKYWVRPLVRPMRPETLYRLLRTTVPLLFDAKMAMSKIPLVGRRVATLIPIGPLSHAPDLNYTEDELKQVKILSALDMLSPKYDQPQRIEDVRAWFEEASLIDISIGYGHNGINAKGKKPLLVTTRALAEAGRSTEGHRKYSEAGLEKQCDANDGIRKS